jgi:SAM-dependent methyltransferase
MATDTAAWDAYWQDRREDGAKALTGIEHDAELEAFWTNALQAQDKAAPFLDLACGAGTVLKTASAQGFTNLHGLDASPAAINALKQSLPQVTGQISSATDTPYSEAEFTTITSQFGFEYAGPNEAAKEVARLLAPNGTFVAIVHKSDGAIHEEVRGHIDHCKTIESSGYIEKAKALFRDVYSGDVDAMNNSIEFMAGGREQVFGLVVPGRPSIASHLTEGTAQLWDKRASYALRDVVTWLDGVEAQRASFQSRMEAMSDAALSQDDVNSVVETLQGEGLTVAEPESFELGGEPAAWIIRATRTA